MFKQIISRTRIALATAVLFVLTATVAMGANPSANLDQCRNGTFASPVDCSGSAWVNGNAGVQNSHWREGDSIAYRMRYENLTTGSVTHKVTIEWDTTQGGKHAIDFITSGNRSVVTTPCDNVSNCTPPPATFAIPNDPNVPAAYITKLPAGERLFACYGCTITAMSPFTLSGAYTGNSSTKVTIFFTASRSNPVMAWGGHIGTQTDWGFGNSASAVSGSPYHMRLLDLDGAGGNQDRSLQAAAVVGMGGTTTRSGSLTTNNFQPGTPISDTMYLTGTNSTTPIAGTVQFYYCAGTLAALPDCNTATNTAIGSPVAVTAGTNGGFQTATASSMNVSFGQGSYCFRAVFTPDASVPYPGVAHTNQVSTGWGAECFFVSGATAVTVSSFEATSQPAMAADSALMGLGLAGALMLGGVALVAMRKR